MERRQDARAPALQHLIFDSSTFQARPVEALPNSIKRTPNAFSRSVFTVLAIVVSKPTIHRQKLYFKSKAMQFVRLLVFRQFTDFWKTNRIRIKTISTGRIIC